MPDSDRSDPVGTVPIGEDTWRTESDLFRYTLIPPLLRRDRQRDGTRRHLREAIAAQPRATPHLRAAASASPPRRREQACRQRGRDLARTYDSRLSHPRHRVRIRLNLAPHQPRLTTGR